jgi:hypothetical protein
MKTDKNATSSYSCGFDLIKDKFREVFIELDPMFVDDTMNEFIEKLRADPHCQDENHGSVLHYGRHTYDYNGDLHLVLVRTFVQAVWGKTCGRHAVAGCWDPITRKDFLDASCQNIAAHELMHTLIGPDETRVMEGVMIDAGIKPDETTRPMHMLHFSEVAAGRLRNGKPKAP